MVNRLKEEIREPFSLRGKVANISIDNNTNTKIDEKTLKAYRYRWGNEGLSISF